MNKIVYCSPGKVRVACDARTVTIGGEALVPRGDMPDYVVYTKTIQRWDAPHQNQLVTLEEKHQIIEALKVEMPKLGFNLTID